jgi:hypothetical protein
MLPPAPARFSITTGWPSRGAIASPAMRPRMSVLPPAVKGTMKRSGRSG